MIERPDIQLVDDQSDDLALLGRILSKHGYRVRLSNDTKSALASAIERPPDLILLDVLMSELDGFEVCRRLKADERTRDIPVLFLIGLHTAANKDKVFAVGGADYITKPFQEAELLARVTAHLALSQAKKQLLQQSEQLQRVSQKLSWERSKRQQVERRLSTLMANLPGMAYRCLNGPDWTMTFVSEGCLPLTGYPSATLVGGQGMAHSDLIHPEDRAVVRAAIRSALANKRSFVIEYRLVAADGSQKIVRDQGVGVFQAERLLALEGFMADITEHKRVEERFLKEKKHLETVIDNIPILLTRYDSNARILYLNKAFEKVVGWTTEANKEVDLMAEIYPDPEYRQQALEYMQQASTEWHEFQMQAKSGKIIDSTWSNIRLEDGTQIGIGIDITAHKRAENALRESEGKYRLLFEHLPIPVFTKTREGVYTSCNTENFKYWTVSPIGRTDAELHDSETAAALRKADLQVMETGEVLTVEERLPDTPLGERQVVSRKVPLRDRTGAIVGILGASLDITEQKQVEQALEKRIVALTQPLEDVDSIDFHDMFNLEDIQRLQDAFAKATGVASIITQPDGTAITEPSNFCRLCRDIIRQTERGRIDCHRSDEENDRFHSHDPIILPYLSGGLWDAGADITVGGRHIANWLIGQVRDETQTDEQMRRYAREIGIEEAVFLEAFHEVPSMSRAQFENIAKALFTLANQLSMYAYQNIQQARFITQRKQLEEEHIRQERLVAVGQLAAGIAHDFNNMLTPIIGYAELLKYRYNLPPAAKSDLARIVEQGQRAAKLIRQILDFSRQTINEPRSLNLRVYLNETLKFIERTIPETIRIRFSFEQGDHTINADPTQLQQVVTNLAVNARDAMPDGGTLHFDLSRISLTSDVPPPCPKMEARDWIRLAVRDTGCGITPEVLPRIFEPFFTTKEVGQGAGLGLAQIYGIVRQHQGFINVESQVGEGTTFTLFFPALTVPTIARRAGAGATPKGQGEVILLVEDDQMVLQATQAMLKMLNYQVLTASDGMQALAVYRSQADQIALVLTDAVMPRMDGVTLASVLQTEAPDLPVLLISGYARDVETVQATRLQKPLSLPQLAQALREALAARTRQ